MSDLAANLGTLCLPLLLAFGVRLAAAGLKGTDRWRKLGRDAWATR